MDLSENLLASPFKRDQNFGKMHAELKDKSRKVLTEDNTLKLNKMNLFEVTFNGKKRDKSCFVIILLIFSKSRHVKTNKGICGFGALQSVDHVAKITSLTLE